jgi:hypothetical protein
MKTLKQAFSLIFQKQRDNSSSADTNMKRFERFHPAPSFWALIPVRIESNKFPHNRPEKQSDIF